MPKKKPASKALAVINPIALSSAAQNLQVVVSVDPEKLREEVETFTQGSATLALGIQGAEVIDQESLDETVRLRNEAGRREKGLALIWKRYKDPLNAAHDRVMELENGTVGYFSGLKAEANTKIDTYVAAELRAKREADAAFQRAAEADRRATLAKAEALMEQGFVKQAQRLEAQAETIVTPTLPEPDIKSDGNRVVEKFTGTCTDIRALLGAIASGAFPLMHDVKGVMRPIVTVDQVVINAIVSRHLSGTKIPGVEITESAKSSGVRY